MNLRILKKLSKRAAPLLPLLGDERKQFPAEPQDSYMKTVIRDRKHFERGRSIHADAIQYGEIKRPARDGKGGWIYMVPPSHPRKGTIMVGAVSGYYEPEWDEETAWESLREMVRWNFAEPDGDDIKFTRRFDYPSQIFRAASEMLASPTLSLPQAQQNDAT